MRARVIAVVAGVVLAGTVSLVVACGEGGSTPGTPASPSPRASLPARTVLAGPVEVRIEPIEVDEAGAAFLITLDTHSVELSADLAGTSRLQVGGVEWAGPTWQGDPPGGHHRQGVLRFPPGGPVEGTVRLVLGGLPEPVEASWRLASS